MLCVALVAHGTSAQPHGQRAAHLQNHTIVELATCTSLQWLRLQVRRDRERLAVTVLMGRQMESVVVRTMAVAKQCVAYLREKRYDPMEFVPLDSVKVRSNLMQCFRVSSLLFTWAVAHRT